MLVEGLYSMEADLWEPRACSCEHLDLDRIRAENIKGSLKWCLRWRWWEDRGTVVLFLPLSERLPLSPP